jgi:NADPH:quinone reductase-like Zn-dependent oxidoreductase
MENKKERRMVYAIRVHEYGGPEVMKWEEVNIPAPGPGQARVRQDYSGLNFIDVYHRTGLYPQASLPFVLGTEGAGEVAGRFQQSQAGIYEWQMNLQPRSAVSSAGIR